MQRKKWSVPFTALDGTRYDIGIYSEDYTGEATTLTGGASPFVTQENNNDDILTPIRIQTGYITIVCDRETWLQVINEGDYVELTNSGGRTCWKGFIAKEAYNGDVFQPVIEYQIPVHCVLTHMQTAKFKVSPFDSPTFATILSEAFKKSPSIPRMLSWCTELGEMPYFLEHRFQRSNFYDEKKDEEQQEEVLSESTYYDVINEICKYFGMTLYVRGDEMIFKSVDGGDIKTIFTQDIDSIEEYGMEEVHTPGSSGCVEPEIGSLTFKSNENDESILQPVNDIRITGSINQYEDFDGTFPKSTVEDWVNKHETGVTSRTVNDVKEYTRQFTRRRDLAYPDYEVYENDFVKMVCYEYFQPGSDDDYSDYTQITQTDECPVADVPKKIDYEWKTYIRYGTNWNTHRPVLGLYGKKAIHLSPLSGAINFYFKLKTPYQHTQLLRWKLRVGNKYWNGTNWQAGETYFTLNTDPYNPDQCQTNRRLGDGYNGLRGMIIPISINLQGKLSLEFLGFDENLFTQIYFEDILLKYVRKNNLKEDPKNEITVKANTDNDTLDDYEQECKFATSPDINGYGQVLNHNGTATSQYAYDIGEALEPEVYRKSQILFRRNKPKSILEVMVADSDPILQPYEMVQGDYGFLTYNVISHSHDWRNSTIKVKLIER